MSEISVQVAAINRDSIQKAMETIVKVAKGIAIITPGHMDDKIVGMFDQFATQDWFIDLVGMAIDLFDKKPEEAASIMKALAASYTKASAA